jgi:hypothetical protein
MSETHVPVLVWAGLLVIGGVLILLGRYPAGHGLCALVLLVWAALAGGAGRDTRARPVPGDA